MTSVRPAERSAKPPRSVTILGSTGSIGRSALDVVRHYPGRFRVAALTAHKNIDLLERQVAEFGPELVGVADHGAAHELARRLPHLPVLPGPEGVEEVAAQRVDVTLAAMVGAAGLKPILAAIDAGSRVAVSNKEPVVMAGRLITERARRRGVELTPVDSEPSAIYQCLRGHAIEDVRCIHLTASGGPFYGRARDTLRDVPPEQAAKHPNWNMGVKISVDSATLMNKGLEVIEAMWLFGLPLEKVEVVIHPQSIIHSLVEFNDGNILAHMGITDMKFPIQYALTWPERAERAIGRLDLTRMRDLTFAKPDFREFPCLEYAFEAARAGGLAPAVLNAANETAVAAYCARRIGFLDIGDVVHEVCTHIPGGSDANLEDVLAADAHGRREAERVINLMGAHSISCRS